MGHDRADCRIRLAPQVGIMPIFYNVAFELVTEAVGTLQDGDLSGHAEGTSKPRIAGLRQLGLAAECAGSNCRQIHSAELQELAMMTKAARVACFRQTLLRISVRGIH